MLGWKVCRLEHELKRNYLCRVSRHTEPYGITGAILRQTGARLRISEIARFQLSTAQRCLLVTGSRAASAPA